MNVVTELPRRDRQALRLAAAFAVLAVLWAVAFHATALPFFAVVVVGGVITGLAGLWLRRTAEEPPPFRLRPRDAALALVVAAAQFGLGHLLFRVGELVAPELTASAAAVYQRSAELPLWAQVLLGGVLTAALEEVFWRGAFTPVVADRVRRRLLAGSGETRRGLAIVLVSTVGYTGFFVPTLQLALIAAAALGGLVWGALLLVTRSVGAPIIAHVVWTSLMVLHPPV